LRIVHLSDVHVQIDYKRLPLRRFGWRRAVAQLEWIGLGRSRRFAASLGVLEQIVREALELAPDHVVLTGDLTALAVEEEFACARRALQPLWRPGLLTVIPGNHDRYTGHAARERRFERHFGELLRSDLPSHCGASGYPFVRLVGAGLAVVGLDSTRLAPLPGLSFGQVGRDQMRSLSRILRDPSVRDRHLAVLVHHAPLHQNARPDRLTHGLLDGQELLHMLAGRRCTLHHGHIHRRYWHPANERRPDVFGAGSSTERDGEGYWIIDLDEGGRISARKSVPRPLASAPAGCPLTT